MTNSGAPEASHRTPLERASDPSTTAHELQQLAADHPEVRGLIAKHPHAYPGLLEWLGSLGDSTVNAALLERKNALLPPEVAHTVSEPVPVVTPAQEPAQPFNTSPVEAAQPSPEFSQPESEPVASVVQEPEVSQPSPEPATAESSPVPVVEQPSPEPVAVQSSPEPVAPQSSPVPVVSQPSPEPFVDEPSAQPTDSPAGAQSPFAPPAEAPSFAPVDTSPAEPVSSPSEPVGTGAASAGDFFNAAPAAAPVAAESPAQPSFPASAEPAPAAEPTGTWSGATEPTGLELEPESAEAAEPTLTRRSSVLGAPVPVETQAPDTLAPQAPANPFAPEAHGQDTTVVPGPSPFAPPGTIDSGTNATSVLPELTPVVPGAVAGYGAYGEGQHAAPASAEQPAHTPPMVYKPNDGRTLSTLLIISAALATAVIAVWVSDSTSIKRDVFAVTTCVLLLAALVTATGVIVRAVRRRFPGQALWAGWTIAALFPPALYFGIGTGLDLSNARVDTGSQMDLLLTSINTMFRAIDAEWGAVIYMALPLLLALVTFLVTLGNRKLAIEERADAEQEQQVTA